MATSWWRAALSACVGGVVVVVELEAEEHDASRSTEAPIAVPSAAHLLVNGIRAG